ncbi:permease [Thermodesulfobacteriota bacterium]
MKNKKNKNECDVHGAPHKGANRTLLAMMGAALLLMVWQVWVNGPTSEALKLKLAGESFPVILGHEIWDVIATDFVHELIDIFPYFMFGVLFAGYIRTFKLAIKLQRYLNRYGKASILLGAGIGMFTPLCACGTLTTAISLLFLSIPLAPVMALLVTSPLMSPSTYFISLNYLGPEWTLIRTLATFLLGIFAGFLTHFLRNKGFKTNEVIIENAIPRGDFHDEHYPDENFRCGCKETFGNRIAAKTNNMFVIYLAKSSEMLWMVGKYVLIGIAVGVVVERYISSDWIYKLFGQEGSFNIVWITLGTIPVFLHQISSSSILFHIKDSLDGTLNGGAGLAFLIGGPVTAMPTMIMFWAVFKKRVFTLYMFICLVGTIALAYSFQYMIFTPYVDTGNALLRGVGSISGGKVAIINKDPAAEHVTIVMDPQRKRLVATYYNADARYGGVVFDAGGAKFMEDGAGKFDNEKYIRNVAAWIEDQSFSFSNRNILVYIQSNDPGKPHNFFSQKVLDSLREKDDFSVSVTNRKDTPEISEDLLLQYSQVWIFSGMDKSADTLLSDNELEIITQYNQSGSGLLIGVGQQGASAEGLDDINRLAKEFGITFSGSVVNSDELQVSKFVGIFSVVPEFLGKYYKMIKTR